MATVRTVAALLCLAALALASPASAEEPFKVIAHRSLGIDALSRDDLSRIFLRKVTRWHGAELKPVEPRVDSPLARAFGERVHGKSPAALRSYWNGMIFAGRDVPPVQKTSDEAVLQYVKEHPGAVGYVSPSADVSGVALVEVR